MLAAFPAGAKGLEPDKVFVIIQLFRRCADADIDVPVLPPVPRPEGALADPLDGALEGKEIFVRFADCTTEAAGILAAHRLENGEGGELLLQRGEELSNRQLAFRRAVPGT